MHLASFIDELEKIAYGSEPSPRGGFLLASHGRVSIPLTTRTPEPPRGVPMVGMTKEDSFADMPSYSPGDFRPVNINKKTAAATTPRGIFAASRQVGTSPGALLRRGPSIADQSRTMGRILPEATKI